MQPNHGGVPTSRSLRHCPQPLHPKWSVSYTPMTQLLQENIVVLKRFSINILMENFTFSTPPYDTWRPIEVSCHSRNIRVLICSYLTISNQCMTSSFGTSLAAPVGLHLMCPHLKLEEMAHVQHKIVRGRRFHSTLMTRLGNLCHFRDKCLNSMEAIQSAMTDHRLKDHHTNSI